MKKSKSNFWFFDPFFWKFGLKTPKSETNQTCEKVTFDAKNELLGRKLLLADIFWPKIKEKNTFLKILKIVRTYDFFIIRQNRDWLRGLPLKTVPTLHKRTWQCRSLKFLSEPERLGQVSNGVITKKSFVASFWLLFVKKSCLTL